MLADAAAAAADDWNAGAFVVADPNADADLAPSPVLLVSPSSPVLARSAARDDRDFPKERPIDGGGRGSIPSIVVAVDVEDALPAAAVEEGRWARVSPRLKGVRSPVSTLCSIVAAISHASFVEFPVARAFDDDDDDDDEAASFASMAADGAEARSAMISNPPRGAAAPEDEEEEDDDTGRMPGVSDDDAAFAMRARAT